ncbi:MAG: YhcH/YjgK/YiaL family protein [Oscillospiraceae bacterium]|nr:YhcH/YjgK/YiaL family protein [Oscillospiraceae bacterium]
MVKYLVMDVDGTLTDGKIYMGQEGELSKAFDIKDGCGIAQILPKYEITPIIITARKSKILENRCKELGIVELHQGVSDKLIKLKEIVGEDFSTVAYAGDDLPDIPCMEAIKKAGGLVLCPSDAIPEIKALSNYVSVCKAGDGAIRDCINFLVQKSGDSNIEKRIRDTMNIILSGKYLSFRDGTLPDGTQFVIHEYMTKDEADCVIESHRMHIDIQYIIEGHEEFATYMPAMLTSSGIYNAEKDVEYWRDGFVSSYNILNPGSLIVVYNGQPHKGAIKHGKTEKVKKLVCKIEI